MKFDFQFINWLFSLWIKKDPAVKVTSVTLNPSEDDHTVLLLLADTIGLRPAMKKLIDHWAEHFPNSDPRYWAIFDTTRHSEEKRLKIFDVVARTVTEYYCAHGKNSDPNFTGICSRYSNEPGSLCTSKGIYRCAETYVSGKFGYAMRLDGLQLTNSNARKRAVVFHGAKYAEDAYVKANGKTGRSEGCTAVGFQYSKDLINKLKNGSPLMVWGK